MFPTVDDPVLDARGLVVRPAPRRGPEGPWTTADTLAAGVARHPDREALVDGGLRLTYSELDQRVRAAAGGLASVGVGHGGRVACRLPNRAALVEAFLATQRLGAVWVGVNTNLTATETAWMYDDADVDLVVATADDDPHGRPVLTVDPVTGDGTWAEMVASGVPAPAVEVDPHAPAAVAYTSGTTGRPKGAVHSQHNLLWPGVSSRGPYPALPGERHGSALALTILNMLALGPLWAFLRGTTSVLIDRTDTLGLATAIRDEGIHRITLVPAQAHDLVHDAAVTREDLATLTQFIIGAGHTPPELRAAWTDKFGSTPTIGYGLSEGPTGVTRERPDRPVRGDGAGYPLDPVAVTIVDEEDRPLPDGEIGEVCIGPRADGPWAGVWTPMLGYWNRPEATAEALRGGLLHTGDLGLLDEHGQLVIKGRHTEMILRGGANVYPAEVERVLLTHPAVAEAAVLGRPDDRLGERVAAAVVARTGVELDVDELAEHCGADLARYKVPGQWAVVDALPRNSMGKVVKADLNGVFPPTP